MDYKSTLDFSRHGFVAVIGPQENPNYFTGSSYSAFLKDAKVFRTVRGAMSATRIWQTADYGRAIPNTWFEQRRILPIYLSLRP